jgi:hypothetical protein
VANPWHGSSVRTLARGSTDILTQGMMNLRPMVTTSSRAARLSPRSGWTRSVFKFRMSMRRKALSMIACQWLRRSRKYQRMRNTNLPHQMDPCYYSQKSPTLSQQRVEYERVQSESALLASQLADALVVLPTLRPMTSLDVSRRPIARLQISRSRC